MGIKELVISEMDEAENDGPDYSCEDCQDSGELNNGESCAACCEHCETDHGVCLVCREDIYEYLAGRAEAAFEGDR